MLGDELLWADQNIDRYARAIILFLVVKEFAAIKVVSLITNTCDKLRNTEVRPSDLTSDHVDLIAVGHRNQHVGIIGASTEKNSW